MQTFSVNSLSETLEVDRGTMVRALKNVPPDAEKTKGRPTYKIATGARALEQHRRNVGTGNGGRGAGSNPPEFAAFDRGYDRMRALPTLARRRAAAIKLMPVLDDMMKAMRAHSLANGEDPDVTGLRSDRVYQLALIGFQGPCAWSHEQTWENLSV